MFLYMISAGSSLCVFDVSLLRCLHRLVSLGVRRL